jgi:hypothetical protein
MNSTIFVLFDKYCPIMDQLGSKDSSRNFQLNCVISYFLSIFTTSCIGPKIDVMEREWKNFNFLSASKRGLGEAGTWATFRLWKNFNPMNSTTFVLFDKYCPIMDQLDSKDSSRDFQLNCVISYFFTYIYYFIHWSKDWCDEERVKKFLLEAPGMDCRVGHMVRG